MKILRVGLVALLSLFALQVLAQPINLDKPVKAGELTCFPDIGNETQFYYISDKPRLATDANGKPQFSFLRYAENKLSAPGSDASSEADGGGIVHAVVALEVTAEQLSEAKREIQRVKPGAQLIGPVVYRSGKFSIVSSFKDPQGGLSKAVVGLGNAPILDGQKAAISIHLTKQGAKILWESFNTSTPDISFTFEMEVGGYRSPKRALIEANFDQIYEHKAFNAAIASQILAAEIKIAFDDLVRSGAIKLTQIGEDEKLDALITTAYNKIADMMFAPLNGSGSPSLGELGANGGGGTSLLDRATTMLGAARTEANNTNRELEERRRAEAERNRTSSSGTNGSNTPADTARGRSDTARGSSGGGNRPASSYGRTEPAGAGTDVARTRPSDAPGGGTPSTVPANVSVPTFAVVASFEMKRIRQQGIFRIDLNKSTSDKVNMRFDENIGDLTRFRTDKAVFREVNLDDPLYIQRELTAFVDGMNATDFGQFINFVNVRVRKTHQGGDITNQETRIDRTNFNKEGNNFRMVYGWKNDNDRKKWMDYEYETEWSFFGGQTVKVPMQKTTSGAINLAPPYQKRTVEVQGDPATVTAAGIRLITAKIFYELAGKEMTKQVTLNPAKGQLSEKLDFMLPGESYDYQYEITWKMADGSTKTSGKKKQSDAILLVDIL